MKTKYYSLIPIFTLSFATMAQGVGINETGASPDESAILDVESTDKGMLIPRMTSLQRTSINGGSPATGLLVYDTDSDSFWFYNGVAWSELVAGAQTWTANGNDVSNANSGNVGVGTDAPQSKLQVGDFSNSTEEHVTVAGAGGNTSVSGVKLRHFNDNYGYTIESNDIPPTQGLNIKRHVDNPTGESAIFIESGSGNVGINTTAPDASAALEINSTMKGFLPPRITTAQRDAIAAPAEGLMIYNTENKCLEFYNNTDWISSCDGSIVTTPPSVPNICNPSNPTIIVDVTNPVTGETWMDRNLGASRAAISSTDAEAYGSLYQWGRGSDGHQCVNRYAGDGVTTSETTANQSSSDTPGHGDFIIPANTPLSDWRSPQNDNLWQGESGTNNPCPTGYRLPTEAELNAERTSWQFVGTEGAFASQLKLPLAGRRHPLVSLPSSGTGGNYWSSTVFSSEVRFLDFSESGSNIGVANRVFGFSVRCIKD